MKLALKEARNAYAINEVPVGAVLVKEGKVIASAHNQSVKHAEFLILQDCHHLMDCDLYVTLEPCCLCAGLIAHTRIRRLYFGAYDIKTGFVDNNAKVFTFTHHKPEVIGGIMESQCARLLRDFFQQRRYPNAKG